MVVRPPAAGRADQRNRRDGSIGIPAHSGQKSSNLETGPRRPPQTSQMTTPPFIAAIFPSPSHLAQTSAASAFRTIRPRESWYCISNSRSPSHSSRVSACPIVPDISWVSSSSNSTTNFHLVRRASWVMPAYCMVLLSKTQDIVVKKLMVELHVHAL